MNSKTPDLETLFGQAAEGGILDIGSQQILVQNISANVIAGAAGKAADEIDATEITLVTAVIDDSGSISHARLADAVRGGQNAMVLALRASKQADTVLLAQWKLGHQAELLHSYVPLDQGLLLDDKNYRPRSGTALYDVWMDALASNVAYAQTLAATGTQVTSVALLITDGQDEHSHRHLARDCAKLAGDLLKTESWHLAFVGVGEKRKFRTIAEEMGFPDGSILVADATDSEIRKAINLASQSIVRASQGLVRPGRNSGFFGGGP